MPEWFNELLIAVGGGSVVLVGVLTIFKSLFIKLFETGIEASFEKNLEKYRNKLSRSTKAFDILLEREMRFYERMEPIFAELVPLVHDLLYYMTRDEDVERNVECEAFRKNFSRYMELTKELKNETLIHQSYIPKSVFMSSTALVKQMQDNSEYWFSMVKYLFAGEYDKIDYTLGVQKVDEVLLWLTKTELTIKARLEELSTL